MSTRPSRDVPYDLLRGVHVLVVEDDSDSSEILGLMLTHYGALVTVTGTADEALAAIREAVPHVILTDVTLPGDDGYELRRRLRQIPEVRRIPVVAVTGHSPLEGAGRLPEFEAYVQKPVNMRALCDLIRTLVDESQRPGRLPEAG